MKRPMVCLLLLFAVSAVAADDSPVTGMWRVHTSIAGKETDQTCTLADDNGVLSGSCAGEDQATLKVTGRVNEMNVSWTSKSSNDDGDPITLQYVGRLDAGRISGVVTIPESGSEGDFIARPANASAAQ